MATTITPSRGTAPSHRRLRSRAIAVAAAVLAALLVWAVAVPLLGVQLTVRTIPSSDSMQTIGAGFVLAVSLLASLLGWGLLAVLERRTQRAGTVWTVAAGVVLLVSLAGPLTAAVTPGSKVSLVLLHLSLAVVLIPLLRRTSPSH
ncbi:MAG: DUF6069 family protein [Allobranchiibius sp.]